MRINTRAFPFTPVPGEVVALRLSGVFDRMKYTHVSSTTARPGIGETGRIMAPALAMAAGFVPFSGEIGRVSVRTVLIRSNYVSLSKYPDYRIEEHWRHVVRGHSWRHYIESGSCPWTLASSRSVVAWARQKLTGLNEQEPGLDDFLNAGKTIRRSRAINFEEVIRLEEARQQAYDQMQDDERDRLSNPKPDLYVFHDESVLSSVNGAHERLSDRFTGEVFGSRMKQYPHPLVPAEVSLRFLCGMFTAHDPEVTRDWISRVVGYDVPVGSLDALATWEEEMDIKHL